MRSRKKKINQKLIAALVVVIVAALGTYLLIGSHAATLYAGVEGATGLLGGTAATQTVTGGDGDKDVQFGTASTGSCATTNTMAPPTGYTASELDFNDSFCGTTLNTSNWNTYITARHADGAPWDGTNLPAGGSSENVAYGTVQDYCMPSQVSVNNALNLTLQASSAVPGFTAVTGCVSTYGHFEFKSGYMQFLVKMPDTTEGGFPAIWFMEGPDGTGGNDGEMDLEEGGYQGPEDGLSSSISPNDIMSSHFDSPTDGWEGGGINTGVDLTSGYNVIGIQYTPGSSIKTYFNGTLVYDFTSGISSYPYEAIINNSEVAGTGSANHTHGTEPYPQVMSIRDVQAYD